MAEKPMFRPFQLLFLLLGVFCSLRVELISAVTDSRDTAALRSLMAQWQNPPPTWGQTDDPCGYPWVGVACNGNNRVTSVVLTGMNIKGQLDGDIAELSELTNLDLSINRGLTGSLTPRIGDLKKLTALVLIGCSFTGVIPQEIGSLSALTFLALNSNNFTGEIPPTLGNLSQLYWLDLGDNQLTGSIPVSTDTTPGLDMLIHTKHFHFNENLLSGVIPPKLFSPDMILIHAIFDNNQLTGTIPETLGAIKTLEVLRLDSNRLQGPVPRNLNNLTSLVELNLGNNQLSGNFPDLTGMHALNYVDLSNNSFTSSTAPTWFSTIQSLTALIMENANLQGPVPESIFSSPLLKQVLLKNNHFNDTLDMGSDISQQLQIVDLENNEIDSVALSSAYTKILILKGNPVCGTSLANTSYCQLQPQSRKPYSTSLANCGNKTCVSDLKLNPQSCECALPISGTLYFRAPSFRDLSNATVFHDLEMTLSMNLILTPGYVSIQNPFFNTDNYLQLQLDLFPSTGRYFNQTDGTRIGYMLTAQIFKPPSEFGPYYFLISN